MNTSEFQKILIDTFGVLIPTDCPKNKDFLEEVESLKIVDEKLNFLYQSAKISVIFSRRERLLITIIKHSPATTNEEKTYTCDYGRRRSICDLYLIMRYYLGESYSFAQYNRDFLNAINNIQITFCDDVKKIVTQYATYIVPQSSILSILKHNKPLDYDIKNSITVNKFLYVEY